MQFLTTSRNGVTIYQKLMHWYWWNLECTYVGRICKKKKGHLVITFSFQLKFVDKHTNMQALTTGKHRYCLSVIKLKNRRKLNWRHSNDICLHYVHECPIYKKLSTYSYCKQEHDDRGRSWRSGTRCDCKPTGCGFDPHRGDEIFT